jgi:hypothetical protein
MRVGKKRTAILSGAAHVAAAATALAGTMTALGGALALGRPAPLTQLPPLLGRARRAGAPRGRSLADAARALARGETWRRREQIVVRARSWHAPDPAETVGLAWSVSGADEAPAGGPVLWGIASARAGAIVAFFPTRARAEAALREVRAEHPGLADGSRRVVRVDLGLSPGDSFRPERAAVMGALPPRVLAISPGPTPFFLLQG